MSSEQRCFFHPDSFTRLTCVECGKSICPACMLPFEVGLVCPLCARGARRASNAGIAPLSFCGLIFLSVLLGYGYGMIMPYLMGGFGWLSWIFAYLLGIFSGKSIFQLIKSPKTAVLSLLSCVSSAIAIFFSPYGLDILGRLLFLYQALTSAQNASSVFSSGTSPWIPAIDLLLFLLPVLLFLRGFSQTDR